MPLTIAALRRPRALGDDPAVTTRRTQTSYLPGFMYSRSHLKDLFKPVLEECMRRSELIRKIQREARRQDVERKRVEAAKHDAFWLGSIKIPIPRHAEIGQRTTEDILHECEAELG